MNSLTPSALVPLIARYPVLDEVAVIGGGRWAKVYCRVLSGFASQLKRIHLLSRRNSVACQNWIDETFDPRKVECQFVVWDNLQKLLEQTELKAAIVANLPSEHYPTAKRLLAHGVGLLVEKPFTSTRRQANELITQAIENDLVLHVGHEFLVASYVHHFRQLLARHNTACLPMHGASRVLASWRDAPIGLRSGILKKPDLTTSVVNDLYPHILSQLTVLFGPMPIRLYRINIAGGGGEANLDFHFGPMPVQLALSRSCEQTDRSLSVETESGTFRLDYSTEPASIYLGDRQLESDPLWDTSHKPLSAEVAHLFQQVHSADHSCLQSALANQHVFEATWQAESRVVQLQQQSLRTLILADEIDLKSKFSEDALHGLRQHLAAPLLDHDLVRSPKDTEQIDAWVKRVFRIIRRLANQPFTSQRDILSELGVSRQQLLQLNAAIRDSDFAQRLLIHGGHGSKYLKNTIVPIIRSCSFEKALNSQYQYPYRIGIYAGRSCMFYCTFCGRNHQAKYERNSVSSGNELLKKIFCEAPKDDPHRFYLSGGLEPLTNSGIGDLISCGASQGFKLSLYTNAFMLTPKLLEKQPGLWDLNTLRISFYGIDALTTEAVTQKKKSFDQVVANAKQFLAERNRRGSDLKLGFNFVMLPGKTDQILQLAEVLGEINRSAGGGRQIDFLTLREDYSVPADQGISREERQRLIKCFKVFEARCRHPDLADLHVDFGYSLNAIKEGHQGQPLEMVTYEQMRPRAYPQVSVVVDLLGDIYAYREAGFLDRHGAGRYILGRISETDSFEKLIRKFIKQQREFVPKPNDTDYFDIFDYVVTKLLNQADQDRQLGIPFERGPIACRLSHGNERTELPEILNAHFADETSGVN